MEDTVPLSWFHIVLFSFERKFFSNSAVETNEPGATDRGHLEADEHDAADLVGVAASFPGGRFGGEGLLQVEAGLERWPRRHNLQRA